MLQGFSFKANESITAYCAVAANASSTTNDIRVEIADTSTSLGIGIAQDVASTDGAVVVAKPGEIGRALLATTTVLGSWLTWQTGTGQLMPVDPAATITAKIIAQAYGNGTNGSIIPVMVMSIPNYL